MRTTTERIRDEWAYNKACLESEAERCTDTIDGQRLREILLEAAAKCQKRMDELEEYP